MANYLNNSLVNCLKLCVEKGYLKVATRFAYLCEAQLSGFTVEHRAEYERLTLELERMRKVEEIYGQGCLLHLDDELIVKMHRLGAISDKEVAAAKSYGPLKLSSAELSGVSSDL